MVEYTLCFVQRPGHYITERVDHAAAADALMKVVVGIRIFGNCLLGNVGRCQHRPTPSGNTERLGHN